ncbi:MAG: hypothetical protein HYU81_01125 [Candidatus Brennerbacteria bacterium]|nr:hypothetical protein [Candidatus Brennerbacteria bacterium]
MLNNDGAPRKGVILEEAQSLRRRKDQIRSDIRDLKLKHKSLKERHQPEINQLSAEADRLAIQFRERYEEASNAYANDEKARAKSLSMEGRAAQDACEALNRKAKRMREELGGILRDIQEKRRESDSIREKLNSYAAILISCKRPRLEGFSKEKNLDLALEKFLDRLPQTVLREIEEVRFISEMPISKEGNRKLGDANWNPKTKKAHVRVYHHAPEQNHILEETIAHEIAHEIFFKYITSEEKREWEKLYLATGDWFTSKRAIRSHEEDFCECFAKFFLDASFLEKGDFRKYAFIKLITKRLEDQYEKT